MHGRALPPARRDLFDRFADALATWDWDVALLQEVPPWWPARLAPTLGSQQRLVLTSRNAALPLRRAIATRWPDLIRSNGGGANAILVGGAHRITTHRTQRLCLFPERRWLHAVALEPGIWIGNLHLTVHDDGRARAEAALAGRTLRDWAAGAPALLGGDFNVRELALAGFERLGGHDVDHVYASRGGTPADTRVLEHAPLSDHAPVLVTVPILGSPP